MKKIFQMLFIGINFYTIPAFATSAFATVDVPVDKASSIKDNVLILWHDEDVEKRGGGSPTAHLRHQSRAPVRSRPSR
jgi:hypothetical protein